MNRLLTEEQLTSMTTSAQQIPHTFPPSSSSSPSHEFSFTISFNNSSSPADEIFSHGHLLPLHLLTNPPNKSSPPRSSTNSLDESFSLPITGFQEVAKPNVLDESQSQRSSSFNNSSEVDDKDKSSIVETTNAATSFKSGRGKNKSFSLPGLKRWRSKGLDQEYSEKPKRKLRISDVSQFISRMVRPLMFFKGNRMMRSGDLDRDRLDSPSGRRVMYSQSLSGNLMSSTRDRSRDLRGRRAGEFSAPASMRTSPTNSGRMLGKAGLPPPASDSTMEELQGAIQAAIAHCKNSINASQQQTVRRQNNEPLSS